MCVVMYVCSYACRYVCVHAWMCMYVGMYVCMHGCICCWPRDQHIAMVDLEGRKG
jgi:hypothetical protein